MVFEWCAHPEGMHVESNVKCKVGQCGQALKLRASCLLIHTCPISSSYKIHQTYPISYRLSSPPPQGECKVSACDVPSPFNTNVSLDKVVMTTRLLSWQTVIGVLFRVFWSESYLCHMHYVPNSCHEVLY